MRSSDDRRIRVLHLIERLPLGGAENVLRVLAKNIDEERFRLTFGCLRGRGHVADLLEKDGTRVVCLQDVGRRRSHKMVPRIVNLIRSEKADIVQTHLTDANLWGRIAAVISRGPLICKTEHAMPQPPASDIGLGARVGFFVDGMLDRRSDCIIYVSEVQRMAFEKANPSPHIRRVVVPNAFDGNRFAGGRTREEARAHHGFSAEDVIVGTVGRLVLHKGHQDLVEALEQVRTRHANIKMLIVGDGPESARLQRSAKDAGLEAIFLGNRDDVPELMRCMDLYVQPSRREAFGVSIVEAMSVGVLVIGSNVGGIPEIIEDGRTGVIVPPSVPEALAKAILTVIEDPALAKNLAVAGKEMATSKFSGGIHARRMEDLYTSLVGRRRNGRA